MGVSAGVANMLLSTPTTPHGLPLTGLPSSELRSTSTDDSFQVDKVRLRVSRGGALVQDSQWRWKYHGGDTYLESVPITWRYHEFMFRLAEKASCAVSVKYLLPGEDLDPESLITVTDDDDLQEMYEEYQRGMRTPGTPIKTFRLRVFLFPAIEEPFTPEELADGEQFFSTSSAERTGKAKHDSGAVRALVVRPSVERSNYSSALSSGASSPAGAPNEPLAFEMQPLDREECNEEAEAEAWQAGFEAGQEAAAWARMPSAELDAAASGDLGLEQDESLAGVDEHVQGKNGETYPKVVAMAAQSVLTDGDGGFTHYWQGSDGVAYHDAEDGSYMHNGISNGYNDSSRTDGRQAHGYQHDEAAGSNSVNARQLPSYISAFGGKRSGASGKSGDPPSPVVPPVADMVTSGVRLPSHISAFGDNSSDERIDPQYLPTSRLMDGPPAVAECDVGMHCQPLALPPPLALDDATRRRSFTINSPSALHFPKVHCVPQEEIRVIRRIGEGAFGEVSLASSPIFGEVAVKWLKPGKVEKHTESFWGEAETLASVNHPNVLRFYGVIVESHCNPTCVGIMTEYMRGGSLADVIRRGRYLPLRQRAEMALGAVKGLAYLHEMRIVHFDLKPDNLLLDTVPGGGVTVKVADFGLHKHKKEHQSFVSGVHDLRGTLPYMAPELVSDPTRVSEKADVWSLGMVLWEMLTLQVPFSDLTPQLIVSGLMVGNLQPPVPEWCEPEWRSLLEACWEVSPAARPHLRDLAYQLEAILAGLPL